MKPILLYKSGEITPHGDPVLCHFGPGCTIAPHERSPETKTIITMHGEKFTVKGEWRDISRRAGYGDAIQQIEADEREERRAAKKGKDNEAAVMNKDTAASKDDRFSPVDAI